MLGHSAMPVFLSEFFLEGNYWASDHADSHSALPPGQRSEDFVGNFIPEQDGDTVIIIACKPTGFYLCFH